MFPDRSLSHRMVSQPAPGKFDEKVDARRTKDQKYQRVGQRPSRLRMARRSVLQAAGGVDGEEQRNEAEQSEDDGGEELHFTMNVCAAAPGAR